MGVSRMQLHRKLKALTDQSATEFIRTVRLKRAAEMLQKGHDNVSQVAYQVGFSSLSYFTKCFKELYGHLPSEMASKAKHQ
jgi:AraC-like DNA-binding protein